MNTAQHIRRQKGAQRGFSMIETLVAITMLTLAVSAPLTLAGRSLIAANYAKDQVTAFNLAQEAIEVVRSLRDRQLICIAHGVTVSGICNPADDWLTHVRDVSGSLVGTTASPTNFTVNTNTGVLTRCTVGAGLCAPLNFQSSTGFYTYESGAGYTTSRFTRTVTVTRRDAPATGQATIRSVVTWTSGALGSTRTVSIEEDILQWVPSQ